MKTITITFYNILLLLLLLLPRSEYKNIGEKVSYLMNNFTYYFFLFNILLSNNGIFIFTKVTGFHNNNRGYLFLKISKNTSRSPRGTSNIYFWNFKVPSGINEKKKKSERPMHVGDSYIRKYTVYYFHPKNRTAE